ncbi:MAG: HEPN domain-containing protein [Deltaproteobacteria bacterium]|nr:HEPN domain-containing protein [Deltaproteobacteria bacterium]
MNDAEITLIRYRMDRSKEALSAARLMYEKDHYNDAVNRLYYSCFYAVAALLATEGVHPGKHTAVRAFLNKNWIKTSKLSKETGRLYNTLFDRREKGDYGDYFRFNADDVEDWLKKVEKAIEEIFQVIEKQLSDS